MTEPIIEFKDFSFKYNSQAEPTLKKINLKINKGEKILLVAALMVLFQILIKATPQVNA